MAAPQTTRLPSSAGCITNTGLKGPGYAMVIVYHDEPSIGRTFLMGHESKYIGKGPSDYFRQMPDTIQTNQDRINYVKKTNQDYIQSKISQVVLRKDTNPNQKTTQWKYTIQFADNTTKYGFPKGRGLDDTETSDVIAKREFFEEIGYQLNSSKLLCKSCITNKKKNLQCIVFHYKVDDEEKKAIIAAYTAKKQERVGELFDVGFYSESQVKSFTKNYVSEQAFNNFNKDVELAPIKGLGNKLPKGGEIKDITPIKSYGGRRKTSRKSRKGKKRTRKH